MLPPPAQKNTAHTLSLTCAQVHARIHTRANSHTFTHTFTHIHTRTRTRAHTHTRTISRDSALGIFLNGLMLSRLKKKTSNVKRDSKASKDCSSFAPERNDSKIRLCASLNGTKRLIHATPLHKIMSYLCVNEKSFGWCMPAVSKTC